ncbi:hypothetical protein N7481_001393 [Penicillium waksmanii]|uniref:uncharacterized protein n=1 Tax=Penicillium waksmanii TaxID=69791 RepID=UPI0025479F2E|nr:uncharacterized protein N7481_001393 [Penicillium waksmanii]KAJ6000984.1 hypothetical protein N7481_001393 [Penicillium waksmanii]
MGFGVRGSLGPSLGTFQLSSLPSPSRITVHPTVMASSDNPLGYNFIMEPKAKRQKSADLAPKGGMYRMNVFIDLSRALQPLIEKHTTTTEACHLMPSENLIDASTGAQFVRQIQSAAAGTPPTRQETRRWSTGNGHGTLPRLPPLTENKEFYEALFVLPTRKVADDLFQDYWEHVDPIFPWLDRETITAGYYSLWSTGTDMTMNEKALHCLLNLIFATACKIGSPDEANAHTQSASLFYGRAKLLMSFNLMEMRHLEIIQILLLSAVYLQHTNFSEAFLQNISLAIHIAQTLDLHSREFTELLADSNDRELARRLWFGCIILDRIAAMTFGSKPKISQDVANHASIPLSAAQQPQASHQSLEATKADFYSAFCHLHVVLGDILESFYAPNSTHSTSPELKSSTAARNNDLLSPETLANLFRLESDLCTWHSTLKPYLQVNMNRENTRPANVLHARAERDIIEFFNYLSNQSLISGPSILPSHWYIISYIYMAATALIAEQLFPNTQGHIPISKLNDLLDQVDRILQSCEPFKSSSSANERQVPRVQIQAPDSPRSGDELLQDQIDYDFGPTGFNMNTVDEYPFRWNVWPVSYGDLGSGGFEGDTLWAAF